MKSRDFSPGQRPFLHKGAGGYLTFVPPPLPPSVSYTSALVTQLSDADRAIGELAGVARTLPNPRLLSRALIRREAVHSSRIEGTRATLSELSLYELAPSHSDDPADAQEVFNYVRAADFVLAPDRRLPLSLPLLKRAHEILMPGTHEQHTTPGEFRESQNWIGRGGAQLSDAVFVPPSPENLWPCLDPLEKYLHATPTLPALLRIGAVHYQFEAIHPFLDGNGRIGRLLIMLLLVEWNLLPGPLLDLSAYIEPRRDEYYAALLRVSTHGDWSGWLSFFLAALEYQGHDVAGRAQRLQSLRDEYRARVTAPRASGLLLNLVDELFGTPALTIRRAQEILSITPRAALVNVERLVAAGVITEIKRSGRQRLFVAHEIVDAIEGRPERRSSPTMRGVRSSDGSTVER